MPTMKTDDESVKAAFNAATGVQMIITLAVRKPRRGLIHVPGEPISPSHRHQLLGSALKRLVKFHKALERAVEAGDSDGPLSLAEFCRRSIESQTKFIEYALAEIYEHEEGDPQNVARDYARADKAKKRGKKG